MTSPLFPYLPGLTFPVERAPVWDTSIETAVSGREARYANRTQPRYRYAVPISGLDAGGQFPGLVANSKHALEALFNATAGGAGVFNFWDADDCTVERQPFGTGDGATTQFQLYRTTPGGWSDAVYAPVLAPSAPKLTQAGGLTYAPHNFLTNSFLGSSDGLTGSGFTIAGSQADPFGGTSAVLMTETATTAVHYSWDYSSFTVSQALVGSIYLKPGTVSIAQIVCQSASGSNPGFFANFDLAAGSVTNAGVTGGGAFASAAIAPVGGGWQRCSIYGVTNVGDAGCGFTVVGLGGNRSAGLTPSYAGSTGNTFSAAFPQLEYASAGGAPSIFKPTLVPMNYGSPSILANGALQTSGYSISATGLVTFNSAPSNGAALTWTGAYWWPCTFDDDTLALSKIMGGIWSVDKIGFTTRIA